MREWTSGAQEHLDHYKADLIDFIDDRNFANLAAWVAANPDDSGRYTNTFRDDYLETPD